MPTSPSQTYTSPPSWSGMHMAVWWARRRNIVPINLFKSFLFACFYPKNVSWVRSLNDCLSNCVSSSRRAVLCFPSCGSRDPYLKYFWNVDLHLIYFSYKIRVWMLMPSLWYCLLHRMYTYQIPPFAKCSLYAVMSYGVKICSPLSLTSGLIGLHEIIASIWLLLLQSVLLLGFVGKCFEKTDQIIMTQMCATWVQWAINLNLLEEKQGIHLHWLSLPQFCL